MWLSGTSCGATAAAAVAAGAAVARCWLKERKQLTTI